MTRILSLLALGLLAAGIATAQPVEIFPVECNTSDDDFAPVLARSGRVMYLTVDRGGNAHTIESANRTPSGWSASTQAPGDINDGEQNGCPAMTPDGQFMIFASFESPVDGRGRTDLYSARRVNGAWGEISNLGLTVNSSAWDSHPTLSSDGRTLYFASDRKSGRGGVDLYVSYLDNGRWTAATPVDDINTEFDEMAPRIAADNATLFFASNRPGGQGGHDLYVARRSGNDFRSVRNLGAPINSPSNELFYTVVPNSKHAYFSSDRSGKGGLDIFLAVPNPFPSDPIVAVSGVVTDAVMARPLGATIVITDLTTGREIARLQSDDRTGEYAVELPSGHAYSVTAARMDYLFYSERYDVPRDAAGADVSRDIPLTPLTQGRGRLLVFFDFDSDRLSDESRPELERLVELMRDQPQLRILLEGHTDDVGSDTYNDDLSARRAGSVRVYLNDAGVDLSRVKITGLGKRLPLIPAQTDEARARNRRVEMKVLP